MSGLRLGLGLGLTRGGGLPYLPSGYAFLIDNNGVYLRDNDNNYLIAKG